MVTGIVVIAQDDVAAVIPGLCLVVPGLVVLGVVLPVAVCVDGCWLFARDIRGWGRPVRLDALTEGYVDEGARTSAPTSCSATARASPSGSPRRSSA